MAESRGIPLQGGASKRCDDIGFYNGSLLKGDQTLKTLDKQYYVSVVNVLANQYYFALAIRFIEMGVEIAKI